MRISPKTCDSGRTSMYLCSKVSGTPRQLLMMPCKTAVFESSAPFGVPVVPPVIIMVQPSLPSYFSAGVGVSEL